MNPIFSKMIVLRCADKESDIIPRLFIMTSVSATLYVLMQLTRHHIELLIIINYIINILSCPVLDDGSEISSKSGTPSPMVSRTRATVSSSDLLRDYRETSVASSRGSSDITEPDPGDNTGLAR